MFFLDIEKSCKIFYLFFPALYVALKDAPDRICDLEDNRPKIVNVIKALLGSDMVPLAQNGVRATGYYFLYLLKQHEELPQELIGPFCRYILHGFHGKNVL